MGSIGKRLNAVQLDAGDEHLEGGGDRVGLTLGAKADGGAHDGVRGVDVHLLGGQTHGTLEAGAVAHGEEGLGIGPAAGATQLLGGAQVEGEAQRVNGGGSGAAAGGVGGH